MINLFGCRGVGYLADREAALRFASEDAEPRGLFKLGVSVSLNEAGCYHEPLGWAGFCGRH